MSGFGAFCPLPLRLGGSATEGWTAEQQSRMAGDLAAVARLAPFAWLRVTGTTIEAYRGWDAATSDCAVTASQAGSTLTLTWPSVYTDDYGDERLVQLTAAQACAASATAPMDLAASAVAPAKVDVVGYAGTGTITVVVWGQDRERALIEDYGGTTDKANTRQEVTPYAWSSYRMLQDARGSSYSIDKSGLVHCENLAMARAHAARWRDAERLAANANPETASEALEDWRVALGVRLRSGESTANLRARCSAKFQALKGPTPQVVDDTIRRLVGDYLVSIERSRGTDLANPPAGTYWPTINPGWSSYSLGGGAWLSDRSHLTITLQRPPEQSMADYRNKREELVELLDRALPVWMDFTLATTDDGFRLSIDRLDFRGFG